jgi:polysaccharide biosynthesis protein PslG
VRRTGWPWIAALSSVVAAACGLGPGGGEAGGTCRPGSERHATWASGFVGMSTHLLWDPDADVEEEVAALAASGVRAVREDFLWEVVEPQPGRFDWERTDRVMRAAARHGVSVLAILGYSAPWSSSDPSGAGQRNHPPADRAAFARYGAAVAQRYAAGSELWHEDGLSSPLIGVEIWNEAWGWWAWRPDPDPEAYAALAREAALAVRAAAPGTAIVLTADPFQVRRDGTRRSWFEQVLDADPTLPDVVDVYAVHPYPEPRHLGPGQRVADQRWAFDRVELVEELATARDVSRPVWITEIGWSTADAAGGVSEAQQADYLVAAVDLARGWDFVERIFLYTWSRDRPDPGDDLEVGFGLRRSDGSLKPAGQIVSRLLRCADADEQAGRSAA